MQSVAQILSSNNAPKLMQQSTTGKTPAGQMISSEATTLDSSEREQLTFVITQVFTIIKRFYPRTWGQGWASEAEVRESQRMMWKLLSKSGQVPNAKGLERLQDLMIERGGDWPPSIPDIVKCLRPVPSDYGYLSNDDAWSAVKRNAGNVRAIQDEAVQLAAMPLAWDLKHSREDEIDRKLKPRFIAAYEGAINRIMRGEELKPMAQLERQEPVAAPHPAVAAMMAQDQGKTGRAAAEALLAELRSEA